jgi:hypothetical protein
MIDDDNNNRRQIVNEDIKRILIDRDITTIKQAFYRILCSEIRNNGSGYLYHINSFRKVNYKLICQIRN